MKKAVKRAGFTLVELLVVIAIIGILVGMLIPAVGAVSRRAAEFAIHSDVNNIEIALESFKTKYGFYPPDFSDIDNASEFLPYLNRIAPNHEEFSSGGLQIWWDEIGVNLTPETAMAFWLSGLVKDAQFPLTFPDPDLGQRVPFPAYNVQALFSNGQPVLDREREVFIDIPGKQIQTVPGTNLPDLLAIWNQTRGANKLPMLYFSASSYERVIADGGYFVGGTLVPLAPYFNSSNSTVPEEAVDRFQIITSGVDGDYGVTGDVLASGPRDRDNVCSFADGRLERLQF